MVSGYGAFRSAYIFSAAGPRIRARLYRVSSLTLRGNDGGRAAFVYVSGAVFFRPIDRDVSREGSPTPKVDVDQLIRSAERASRSTGLTRKAN